MEPTKLAFRGQRAALWASEAPRLQRRSGLFCASDIVY